MANVAVAIYRLRPIQSFYNDGMLLLFMLIFIKGELNTVIPTYTVNG